MRSAKGICNVTSSSSSSSSSPSSHHPSLTSFPLLLLLLLLLVTEAISLSMQQPEVIASIVDNDAEGFPMLFASACLDQLSSRQVGNHVTSGDQRQDPTLALRCQSRHMVRIVDLLYGHVEQVAPSGGRVAEIRSQSSRAPDPRCHHAPADCVTHLPSKELDVPCIGEDKCLVTVPADDRGRLIPGCNRTITYVQASYQCIPESAVVDVCSPEATGASRVTLVGQRGFLRTPGYPVMPYPDNVDCELTVEAPHPFQRIHLDAVDIELEKNGTGCSDWLETFDGLRSMTLCGRRTRRRLGTSEHQSYRIRFRSNARVRMKGFWIYYEVVPIVREPVTSFTLVESPPTTSGDEHEPSTVKFIEPATLDVKTTSTFPPETRASHRVSYTSEEQPAWPLFIESLAGIFLGLLVCVLVVCLVSIFVIRRRHMCAPCSLAAATGAQRPPRRTTSPNVESSCYVVRPDSDAEPTAPDDRLLLRLSTDTSPNRFTANAADATLNSKVEGCGATPKSNAEKLRQRLLLQEQRQQRQQQLEQWEQQWDAKQYGRNMMRPETVDITNVQR